MCILTLGARAPCTSRKLFASISISLVSQKDTRRLEENARVGVQ